VPCSRTEAERYITEGWVRVDGKVVEEPYFQVSHQRVEVNRQGKLQPPASATFLLHKPPGVDAQQAQEMLLAAQQWQGDTSGIRRLKSQSANLSALLALPPPAAGLAVFSQDFRIVRKLREDAHLIEQELVAEVTGAIAGNGLARLGGGLVRDGRALPPARVSWQSENRLRIAAKGLPLEAVPWMCEQVGLRLTALKRIRIGRVPMAGLPQGQWRFLLPDERF
jgi:23S rRNA pseudouridine2604 synthase